MSTTRPSKFFVGDRSAILAAGSGTGFHQRRAGALDPGRDPICAADKSPRAAGATQGFPRAHHLATRAKEPIVVVTRQLWLAATAAGAPRMAECAAPPVTMVGNVPSYPFDKRAGDRPGRDPSSGARE
jgi:hypothetical protein